MNISLFNWPKGGADDGGAVAGAAWAMLSIQTNDKLISDPTVLYV